MGADPAVPGISRRVRHAPWSAEQAARLVVSNLVALAGILTAAYGAASAEETQTVLLWLNLCVGGLAFAGISNALWLVRCHSTTSTWRADVLDAVAAAVRVPDVVDDEPSVGFVVVAGLERYHRPDCAFVHGRVARAASDADLESGDRIACEVCVR